MVSQLESTFETMKRLPVEIFLAPHARAWGRYRKYRESLEAEDPVAPFIDPEGYRAFVEGSEAAFRARVEG